MRYLPVTGGETGTYESSSVIKPFLQILRVQDGIFNALV